MIRRPITIRYSIAERIRRKRKSGAFLRQDFADLGAYDLIDRELRRLVHDGALVQVGYGLYAYAKRSVHSGKPIPAAPLIDNGCQALRRHGYSPAPSKAALVYIEGRTTQVPTGDRIAIPGARVKRKISFGPRVIECT